MTAIAEGTTRRVRREFHELAVARVDRLCDDAVAVTFACPRTWLTSMRSSRASR